jgi:hypothetical protein
MPSRPAAPMKDHVRYVGRKAASIVSRLSPSLAGKPARAVQRFGARAGQPAPTDDAYPKLDDDRGPNDRIQARRHGHWSDTDEEPSPTRPKRSQHFKARPLLVEVAELFALVPIHREAPDARPPSPRRSHESRAVDRHRPDETDDLRHHRCHMARQSPPSRRPASVPPARTPNPTASRGGLASWAAP